MHEFWIMQPNQLNQLKFLRKIINYIISYIFLFFRKIYKLFFTFCYYIGILSYLLFKYIEKSFL